MRRILLALLLLFLAPGAHAQWATGTQAPVSAQTIGAATTVIHTNAYLKCDGVTDNAAAVGTINSLLQSGIIQGVIGDPQALPCMTSAAFDSGVANNVSFWAQPDTFTVQPTPGSSANPALLHIGGSGSAGTGGINGSNTTVYGWTFAGGNAVGTAASGSSTTSVTLNSIPVGMTSGQYIADTTTPNAIPTSTTITSITGNVVHLSASASGILSADKIESFIANTNPVVQYEGPNNTVGTNIVFDRITVRNTRGIGVYFSAHSTSGYSASGIKNSYFTDNGNYWYVTQSETDRVQAAAMCCGVVSGVNPRNTGNFMKDNTFINTGLDSMSPGQQTDLTVSGNWCESTVNVFTYVMVPVSNAYGACLYASDVNGINVTGNYSDGVSGNGFDMPRVNHFTVTGNIALNSGQAGITIFGDTTSSSFGQITGNTANNNGNWTSSPYRGGFETDGVTNYVTFAGNTATDTRGGSATQQAGFEAVKFGGVLTPTNWDMGVNNLNGNVVANVTPSTFSQIATNVSHVSVNGTIAATVLVDQSQASGGSALLAFASTSGLSVGQIIQATSVPVGTQIKSIISNAQVSLTANGVSNSGQKVLTTTATTGAAVGQQCTDTTTTSAIGAGNIIASIQAGVSITLTANLVANTANSDTIVCDPVVTMNESSTATISAAASIVFLSNQSSVSTSSGTYINADVSVVGNLAVDGAIIANGGPTCLTGIYGMTRPSSTALGLCVNGTLFGFNSGSQFSVGTGSAVAINASDAISAFHGSTGVGSLTIDNNNAGTAAQTALYLQNSTANTEGSIILNGGSFSGGNGANAMTLTAPGGVFSASAFTASSGITSGGSILPSGASLTILGGTNTLTFGSTTYDSCTALTTTSGGVLGCTVSDPRLKIDGGIFADEAALDDILAMPALHQYQFKDGYGPGGDFIGFFANDVAAVHPGWVRKGNPTDLTPDGTLQYDQNRPTPELVGAVRQLSREIGAVSAGLPATAANPFIALQNKVDQQQTLIWILFAWCAGLTVAVALLARRRV